MPNGPARTVAVPPPPLAPVRARAAPTGVDGEPRPHRNPGRAAGNGRGDRTVPGRYGEKERELGGQFGLLSKNRVSGTLLGMTFT